MRTLILLFTMLLSFHGQAQKLGDCGLDDSSELTISESKFLDAYMNAEQKGDFDFEGGKVIFVFGNTAQGIISKSEYFDKIKRRSQDNAKVATWVYPLKAKDKIKTGGYNAIITCWVKVMSNRRVKKIVKQHTIELEN